MSLVLKQDLVIEDASARWAIDGINGQIGPVESTSPHQAYGLRKGTKLPEGPLHPIAALAFGMAKFELEDELGFRYRWLPDGDYGPESGWYLVHPTEGPSTDPVCAPINARIVGHLDPYVL